MALVKVTKQLLVDVDDQVSAMARTAADTGYLKDDPDKNMPVKAELLERAMTEWFSAAPHMRDLVPADWLMDLTRLCAQVEDGGGNVLARFFLTGTWKVPHSAKPGYTDPVVRVVCNSLTPATAQCAVLYAARKTAHEERYSEVRKQVKAYLSAAVSLNDAVKRFPSITAYIPKRYLDKMAEKKVRVPSKAEVKAVEAEGDVDKTLLSVVGAVHQLGS